MIILIYIISDLMYDFPSLINCHLAVITIRNNIEGVKEDRGNKNYRQKWQSRRTEVFK